MKQKLFSIFCCLLLSASMVTQAQQVQRISRNSSPKVVQAVKHQKDAVQIKLDANPNQDSTELSATSRRNAPVVKVSPRRGAFPSFNYFDHTDGSNAGESFTWNQTTVTYNSGNNPYYNVRGYIDNSTYVEVSETWCFSNNSSYLPSGEYLSATTLAEGTMGIGSSTSDIRSYGGYVDWYSNGTFYIWILGKSDNTFAWVHNPNHTSKPMYFYSQGASYYNSKTWWTEIGTEPDKYTITFNWGNNGEEDGNDYEANTDEIIFDVSGNTFTMYNQSVFILEPQPKPGYHFVSWSGTGANEITDNGDGTYRLQMNGKNYSIYANFEQDPGGEITAVASPSSYGYVTVSPTGSQAAGTAVTLTPNANPGYVFTGWADGGNDNPRTVYVAGDREYTANFALLRTINVAADPVAYGSVTGGGSYADGATATLTATANSGYKFLQWSDGNTSNPRSFTVNASTAAVTYTAQFIRSLHDFEYHFTYEQDFAKAATGQAASGGSSTQKYYSLRLQMLKNYVATNAVAYPAIAIEIVTTQTSNRSGGYKDYNSVRFPYPATFTNTTTTINYSNRGKIVTSANSGSNFTKFYDANGTSYIFQSGTIKYIAPVAGQTYPFVHVDGTFGGKTVWVTIGTAPSYSITLDNQSATTAGTASVTATYTENTNLTSAITIPTKTGYNFGGYYTSKNGAGSQIIDASGNFIGGVSGYTDALKRWLKDSAVTLYAKWTAKTYTVNLDNQEATTAGTASVTATYNAAMPSATMPTKTGYAFNGYYTSTNGGGTQYYTAAGASARNWNIDTNPSTLYAYWTQKTYTLSATTNPTGLGSVTFSKSAPYHYNDAVTLTAPEVTGYTFSGWGGTNSSMMSGNVFTFSVDAANNTAYAVTANYTANTYNVSFAPNGGSGTMTNQVFTYGEAQNLKANTFTAPTATATYNYNGATGGNSPASATVTATADGWIEGNNYYEEGAEVNNLTATNGATVALTAFWGWTEEITLPTPTKTGYNFEGWSFTIDDANFVQDAGSEIAIEEDVEMTALWNIVTYNLTYEGLEGATNNTNPTTYNVESETITLANPGARDGYVFTGWTCGGEAITEITAGSTGDKTITANWNAKLSSITLEDNRENSFYNTFKTTYDGATGLVVTYARQFTAGRWSTLCLPFNVNKAMFNTLNFGSRIYEFKYATGNADDGVNLYFSIAKSIEAGKGYIVNADATLAARTSFTFPGVNIDLSKDNGAELNSVAAYDNLTGNSSDGNIELVGTLRKGTLKGTTDGNTYMGLKGNKIYYPNISQGSTILAYRGIFRSIEGTLNAERIRIIVDGEEAAELEVINGELQDVQETKKFIENGVLYIERNGIIYDATGRKVE